MSKPEGIVFQTLSDLVSHIKGIKKRSSASLTRFTKDSNIIGRVYIEESIAKDDIALPLMGVLNQMYVSYILVALHLDNLVASGRTVRETIGLVASEGYHDLATVIAQNFGKHELDQPFQPSMETLAKIEDESQRLVCGRLIELDMMGAYAVTESETANDTRNEVRGAGKVDARDPDNPKWELDVKKDADYITSAGAKKSEKTKGLTYQFKAYLYVQLIPYIIEKAVADAFFEFNFVPGFIRRWKQVRAKEIKFFRDFIFARDLIQKQQKTVKEDKSGTLINMLLRQRSSFMRWATQLVGIRPENHNAASSIIVISKQSFDMACSKANVNFAVNSNRERFFKKTFTMLTVVVDPLYGSVDIYINGVNAVGKYTFDMINRVGTKGRDSFDLKQIMQAFNQGITPKF